MQDFLKEHFSIKYAERRLGPLRRYAFAPSWYSQLHYEPLLTMRNIARLGVYDVETTEFRTNDPLSQASDIPHLSSGLNQKTHHARTPSRGQTPSATALALIRTICPPTYVH